MMRSHDIEDAVQLWMMGEAPSPRPERKGMGGGEKQREKCSAVTLLLHGVGLSRTHHEITHREPSADEGYRPGGVFWQQRARQREDMTPRGRDLNHCLQRQPAACHPQR